MKQISSKYLNLNLLSAIANSEEGYVILMTSFGHVVGRLFFAADVLDETVCGLISSAKEEIIKNMETDGVEIIGDGSLISVKDAIAVYGDGRTLSFDELTLHCDQIIGFSPITRESYEAYLTND